MSAPRPGPRRRPPPPRRPATGRRRRPARRPLTGRRPRPLRPPLALAPLEEDLAHYRDTRSEALPADPSEGDLYLGSTIGPCKLIQFLAAGGTGRVYRAHHQRLNFEVAFKLIDPKVAQQEKMLGRFQREAQVSARLNHSNIARVYDVDSENGVHYIIQELVRGQSLEARVQRQGPLEELTCAQIGRALASGLDSIHQAGVVHRDVKPDNVILTADLEPKLLDFGIAKDVDVSTDTHQDTVLGTPKFMAPEQVSDHSKVGPPTDVYGLGATLFFGLAGQAPLEPEEEEGLFAFMNRRLSAPPPRVRDHVPRTHPQLAALIDSMLLPDPTQRPTAAEVEAQFQELEQAISVATGSVSRSAVQAALRRSPSFNTSTVFNSVVGGQGTHGTFAELPLPEILQGIEFNEKTGELDVHAEDLTGRITFKNGQPHDASTSEGERGQAAVYRLLALDDASFTLRRDALVHGARQIPVSF
ncbi:MAG: protein kinase, partial [Planctomycetota bacterium]